MVVRDGHEMKRYVFELLLLGVESHFISGALRMRRLRYSVHMR